MRRLSILADATVEGALGLLLKLPLPSEIRLRWTSYRCARSVTVACSRSASGAIFAFSAPSIRRPVFFVIARSVYQTERPASNLNPGPKNRVHFLCIIEK
jgi:hypothetical protein